MSSLRKVESIRKKLLLCLVVLGVISNLHGMNDNQDRQFHNHQNFRIEQNGSEVTDNVSKNSSHNNFDDSSVFWRYVVPGAFSILVTTGPGIVQKVYDYYWGDPELKELSKDEKIVDIDLKRLKAQRESQPVWQKLELVKKQQQVRENELIIVKQTADQELHLNYAREEQFENFYESLSKAREAGETEKIRYYENALERMVEGENSYPMRSFDERELEFEEEDEEDEGGSAITSKTKKSLEKECMIILKNKA